MSENNFVTSASRVTVDHIGKIVSFDVYPTSTLGTNFNRVKLVAILDEEAANRLINVPVLSTNVYPSLPEGTLKDYRQYQFLKVILNDGRSTAVAIPWIDMSTYQIHEHVVIHFQIEDASMQDVDHVRKVLAANGFNAVNYYIDS